MRKCIAVFESTGNMWMRIHDTLEENGIDTKLDNPVQDKENKRSQIKIR